MMTARRRNRTTRDWTNWSGSLRFTPGEIVSPADDEELAAVVRRAAAEHRVVRVAGTGHSSSALVETSDVLISLEKLTGLEWHDAEAGEAVVRAGSTLEDAGKDLFHVGLALHNLGDVNVQTVVGAVSTGTHGSGKQLQNLAAALIGGRFVSGRGEICELSTADASLLRAARCSLGAIGTFTAVRLKLLPAYRLRRREFCASVDDTLAHLDDLFDEHRNCDFYWYPRSDEIKIRTLDPEEDETSAIRFARCVEDHDGWSHDIISKRRVLKFDEMEYALPADAGPSCFQEIRARVRAVHRRTVAWRILYRYVAADDAYLSTAHGRDTVTISLHHNAGLPYQEYFDDIEPIFRAHGGRPHWGKKHSLRAGDLRPLYPEWNAFQGFRSRFDPDGVLLNSHLRDVLVDEGSD